MQVELEVEVAVTEVVEAVEVEEGQVVAERVHPIDFDGPELEGLQWVALSRDHLEQR